MQREYYFIDINLVTKQIVKWGTIHQATHTGETADPDVYRIFLTKGQFNKFQKRIGSKAH